MVVVGSTPTGSIIGRKRSEKKNDLVLDYTRDHGTIQADEKATYRTETLFERKRK